MTAHRISLPCCLLALLAALPCGRARADDLRIGGSSVLPMPLGHTVVALTDAHVALDWSTRRARWRVTGDFTLENTSTEPVTVTLAFPLPVADPDAGQVTPPRGRPAPADGRPLAWNFRLSVDGRAVRPRDGGPVTHPAAPDLAYEFAYLWDLTLPPAGRARVRTASEHGLTEFPDGSQWASYSLAPAALWHGASVSRAHLELRVDHPRLAVCPESGYETIAPTTPAGATTRRTARGTELTWEARSFAPEADLSVCFVHLDQVAADSLADLSELDLDALTPAELRLLAHRVRAQRGYVFRDESLAEYFGREWWYRPDRAYTPKRLTADERALIVRITAAAKRRAP